MDLARRITFLRRDNITCSVRKDLSADVVDRLSRTKQETRETLLGGAFSEAVYASADKVEGEKAIRLAKARISQRNFNPQHGLKRKASPPSQPKSKPQAPRPRSRSSHRRDSSPAPRGRRDRRISGRSQTSRPRSRSSPVRKGRGRPSRS